MISRQFSHTLLACSTVLAFLAPASTQALASGGAARPKASTLPALASWPQFMGTPSHIGFNPVERTISPANVSSLQPSWVYTSTLGGGNEPLNIASPVITSTVNYPGGIAVIVGQTCDISAIDVRNGAQIWGYSMQYIFRDYFMFEPPLSPGECDYTPALGNGNVYVNAEGISGVGSDGRIYVYNIVGAVDLETGTAVLTGAWPYVSPFTRFATSMTIAQVNGQSRLYFGVWGLPQDSVSDVVSLDGVSGTELWRHVVSDNINGTSVPTVGLVTINGTPQYTVYACNNTGVHALNATDGSELWTGPYSCFTFSTEAIAAVNINNTSTKVLFTPTLNQQQNGVIVALDAATGTPLWTSEPGPGFFGYIQSSPAVATKQGRGVVVYATDHGNVVALNAQNGHTIWSQTEVHASQINSPMIANGVVYLEDANTGYPDIPAVSALSLRTGALLWSYAFSYGNEANPAVVNGTLYVTGQKITNPPSSKFYPLLYAFRLP